MQRQFVSYLRNHWAELSDVGGIDAPKQGLSSALFPGWWWAAHRSALPAWSSLVQKLLLLCPSSAATERVFSIMRNSFDKRQEE